MSNNTVSISNGDSRAVIQLHGAHLTSFDVAGEGEVIFVSKDAIFDAKSAIRGGIPVCFPQFGKMGDVPRSHGFARNMRFSVLEASINDNNHNDSNGSSSVTLYLTDNEETVKLWPAKFRLEVTFTLKTPTQLTITMNVSNVEPIAISSENGGKSQQRDSVSMTCALHTYISASSIDQASVSGLTGVKYLDQLEAMKEIEETCDSVAFNSEVDRIYKDVNKASGGVICRRGHGKSDVSIGFESGFKDAVVWNPWIEKSRRIADLDDNEFKSFFCVESARIIDPVVFSSSITSWSGVTSISVLSNNK